MTDKMIPVEHTCERVILYRILRLRGICLELAFQLLNIERLFACQIRFPAVLFQRLYISAQNLVYHVKFFFRHVVILGINMADCPSFHADFIAGAVDYIRLKTAKIANCHQNAAMPVCHQCVQPKALMQQVQHHLCRLQVN